MARPPFAPTAELRKLVQNLAGIACTNQEILDSIPWPGADGKPLDMKTFTKHFGSELTRGKSLAHKRLKATAFDMALTDRDRTMLIFLLKTQCGFRESIEVQNTGKDGAELPSNAPVFYLPRKDEPPAPLSNTPREPTAAPRRDAMQRPAPALAPALPTPPRAASEPGPRAVGNVRPSSRFLDGADPRR